MHFSFLRAMRVACLTLHVFRKFRLYLFGTCIVCLLRIRPFVLDYSESGRLLPIAIGFVSLLHTLLLFALYSYSHLTRS